MKMCPNLSLVCTYLLFFFIARVGKKVRTLTSSSQLLKRRSPPQTRIYSQPWTRKTSKASPSSTQTLLRHRSPLFENGSQICSSRRSKSSQMILLSMDCSFIAENLNVRASSEYYTSHNQIQTFTWKCQDTSIFGHSLWCMSINSLITECVSTLQT